MIAAMAAVSAISVLRLMSDCAGFSVTTGVDGASTDLVEFEIGAGGKGAASVREVWCAHLQRRSGARQD
jgi:hypothetical protein